jgi:hypothetical protein
VTRPLVLGEPAADSTEPRRAARDRTAAAALLARARCAALRIAARFGRWLPAPPAARLMDQLTAGWGSQAISTAARLGLPDALASGPQTADALAERLQVDPAALQRLLRALTGLDLIREHEGNRFALTARGRLLVRTEPGSLHAIAAIVGGPWYGAFGALDQAVRSGRPVFENLHGEPFFSYARSHREFGALFDASMRAVSSLTDPLIAAAYDFSRFRRLLDVGGGTGAQLHAILRRHASLQGVLLELQPTVERARVLLPDDLKTRIELRPGSFFDALPEGADLCLLKTVLHDWDDRAAREILARCRAALPHPGRLLLVEHVLDERGSARFAPLLDLLMLSSLGGRERTRAEFEQLLADTGFTLLRVIPTLAPLCILEARTSG